MCNQPHEVRNNQDVWPDTLAQYIHSVQEYARIIELF